MEHMTLEKATARLFEDNFDCAQTVFSHFAEELGLDEETALKISAGFGGGMHKGDMCGTVTGGLMVLGLKYGFCEPNDAVGKDFMNRKAMEFERRIQEADDGCLRCREMLGVDPSTPEGKLKAMEIIPKRCPQLVVNACNILEELLED